MGWAWNAGSAFLHKIPRYPVKTASTDTNFHTFWLCNNAQHRKKKQGSSDLAIKKIVEKKKLLAELHARTAFAFLVILSDTQDRDN
jgi:hypothetical protein